MTAINDNNNRYGLPVKTKSYKDIWVTEAREKSPPPLPMIGVSIFSC
jgi:hypothetical protein